MNTKLSSLDDSVRIPAEILLETFKQSTLKPLTTAFSDSGGIAFFFENTVDGIKLTADVEIDDDGSVTASVIPYIHTDNGWTVFQDPNEPVELWEVEEEPPFEETLRRIQERLVIV